MNMDRIAFFQSVDQNKKYDSAITSLFDQISALYNIFGRCNNVHAENITEPNKVKFNISSNSKEDIAYVFDCFNQYRYSVGNIIEVYGRVFEIGVLKQSEDLLSIQFISRDQYPMNVT